MSIANLSLEDLSDFYEVLYIRKISQLVPIIIPYQNI